MFPKSKLAFSAASILKVPKCEIFDHSDFDDFYTIKSLWGSNFGVKIIFFFIVRGSFGAAKYLTRLLSLVLRVFLGFGHNIFFREAFETIC
jgi:hypothetical protein